MKVTFTFSSLALFLLLLLHLLMAEENQRTEPIEEGQLTLPLPTLPLPILGLERSQVSDGASSRGQKTEWPELMGSTVEEAQEKIKLDMPLVQFQLVPPDHFVTMDFNMQRVRLYLDASGKVARPPHIG